MRRPRRTAGAERLEEPQREGTGESLGDYLLSQYEDHVDAINVQKQRQNSAQRDAQRVNRKFSMRKSNPGSLVVHVEIELESLAIFSVASVLDTGESDHNKEPS
jgi:hypothetical protein